MNAQGELEPCPFCGANAEVSPVHIIGELYFHQVTCVKNCLTLPTAQESIKRWNASAQKGL